MKMSSKWDSGIIVWRADGQMQVLKEGNDGVYVVDPSQKGCPVRYGSALAAAQEKASGSCGSRRTATAGTTSIHAAINTMQRRWRSAYPSMPIVASQESSRPLRDLPSAMSRPNYQWGTRGR